MPFSCSTPRENSELERRGAENQRLYRRRNHWAALFYFLHLRRYRPWQAGRGTQFRRCGRPLGRGRLAAPKGWFALLGGCCDHGSARQGRQPVGLHQGHARHHRRKTGSRSVSAGSDERPGVKSRHPPVAVRHSHLCPTGEAVRLCRARALRCANQDAAHACARAVRRR